MQQKYVTRDRYVLILALFIFTIGTYSLFASTNSESFFEVTTIQNQIKGTVTDSNDIPIPGVTVQIKGTSKGTFTNDKGEFIINASPTDILVLTYIGFKTLEVSVESSTELSLVLHEDVTSLDEVTVNAGYYTVKERERTGSISKVTAEEIELQPVISPIQALQGRMAGVEIIPGGNQPGMASTIRIRGRNSLRNEGNYPLYIIDGVPVNSTPIGSNSLLGSTGIDPLNTLNLSNIESIEVLKDADATAIYGSRGANGVILITSKKGKQQKTTIETRLYSGMAAIPNKIDLLNTKEYLNIRKKAFENDGLVPNESNAPDLVLWEHKRNTDWQDYFLGKTSSVTDLNIAVFGGNKNTSFRLGSSYHSQGTIYPGDYDYNRFTVGLSLGHSSNNKKFKINLSVNYGVDSNQSVGSVNLSTSIFRIPPNAPSIFNNDGSLHWEGWSDAGLDNPLQGFFNTSKTVVDNLISNLGVSYEIISGLIIKTNLGYNYYNSRELLKMPQRSYNPSWWGIFEHRSMHLNTNQRSWIIEPQLTYSKRVGKGNVDAIIGSTFQRRTTHNLELQGIGYITEALIGNLEAAESLDYGNSKNTDYKYSAAFARLGYNWNKKYYVNLTARRDGSSRFGSGNRFSNFGAIGTAWIFSKESFINKHLSFLSFGKLRSSYGTTGNDQIPDYGYLDSYEATRGQGGLYPTQLYNPDFSWEINKKFETAIELGFLKDRIDLGISWYRNRSSNQLVGYPLPGITGHASVQANLPATVQNSGWEVELSTLNITNELFQWQTSFNITFPKNILLSYPNIDQSSYANVYRVGRPLNIDLLYQYEGIDPDTGLYDIADINDDGRLDYDDRIILKDRSRKYFGGINNNINYKNLSIQFLWQFVKQEGKISSLFDAGAFGNQRSEVIQALTEGSKFQRISTLGSIANSRAINTIFPYEDASFLRLKTLSVGYMIPSEVIETLGMDSGKIFVTGHNLITLTNYSGMDPEKSSSGTSFAGLRTISCGIQLNF